MVKKGIIISSDTSNIEKNDMEFIFIRAGYTDYNNSKTKNIDKDFEKNYRYAKKNNIKVGTYYESRALSLLEAQEEMRYFINIIKDKVFEYPIAVKLEDDHNTTIYYPLSQQTISIDLMQDILYYMYKQLQIYNYVPIIITYEQWYKNIFKNTNYNFLLENKHQKNDIIYLDIHNLSNELIDNANIKKVSIFNYLKMGYNTILKKVRKK